MIEYDKSHYPPAPVVSIQILNPATGQSATLKGLIDSGAAISVVPLATARQIGLKPVDQALIRGLEAIPTEVPVFNSIWVVQGFVLLGVEFVAVERESVLLGRDVLQHFILTLNGKEGKFDLVVP